MSPQEFDALCRGLTKLQREAEKGVIVMNAERGEARRILEKAGYRVITPRQLWSYNDTQAKESRMS